MRKNVTTALLAIVALLVPARLALADAIVPDPVDEMTGGASPVVVVVVVALAVACVLAIRKLRRR